MPLQLDLAPVAGSVALMATAAVEDIRRLAIPNGVIVGLCLLWPFHLATASNVTMTAGMASIGGAVCVFFAGAQLFSRGLIGGGDVKLLAAATLWTGPTESCRSLR
jgi:prepilin peptidase CpaA